MAARHDPNDPSGSTRPDAAPLPDSGRVDFAGWEASLRGLCQALAHSLQTALSQVPGADGGARLDRAVGQGVGDVTFGLDVPAEERIAAWHTQVAARTPLSVLTEDTGWRHRVPDGAGGSRPADGFAHGGPRIAFDPIDGTRNLMADLRSGWTVVSFAGPGDGPPRLRDLEAGIVSELPTSRCGVRRLLVASRHSACAYEELDCRDGDALARRSLQVDADDRADQGYFPFFRYQASLRPAVASLEAEFLRRLVEHEGADEGSLYDDQYITSAGQLVLTALGTYRVVVDPRAAVAASLRVATTTAKPYDVAGAILVAQRAGAIVTDLRGGALDFPLDCTTPVAFAAWANEATFERLLPHWIAALDDWARRL